MKQTALLSRVMAMVAGACVSASAFGQASGPDVIVGDLPDFTAYTPYNGVAAFAVGTTSCNIGSTVLRWISSTNQHPVIGQNLYRWKMVNGAGQFEMIGQSWLKHGFTALNGTICGPCSNPDGTGDTLDPTCSDPYSSSLNGSQARLGPKYQVNAFTGAYPYPVTGVPQVPTTSEGSIFRRLQVKAVDIQSSLNAGAWFFAEGHYIASDDAAAGNGTNNAAYRRVSITGNSPFTMSTIANYTTQRQLPAIYGWSVAETGVQVRVVQVPSEGQFNLAHKVTPLANGMYHYEYALHNLNSDRSAGSFRVDFPAAGVSEFNSMLNVGFHDVDYHSGEPYSGTDWTAVNDGNGMTWSTQTYAQNINANALRWGTMYTFRFDSDRPPTTGTATIGLFKPGTPTSIVVPGIQVPSNYPCVGDFNADGGTDGLDVDMFFQAWVSGDPAADVNHNGGVEGTDVETFFVHWEAGC